VAQFVSPGVYVQEFDQSAFAARAAATVIGFVGTAPKGPVNTPTLLTSPDAAKQIFGTPLPTAGNRGNFGLHAVMNALNQTSQVWYVRVTDDTERVASGTMPVVVNNQAVYAVDDSAGVTVDDGKMAFLLEVRVKSGTELGIDAYDTLANKFGDQNIFDGSFNQITSLTQLLAEIEGGPGGSPSPSGTGVFVQVFVPMSSEDKTYGNLENFISRFNRVMIGRFLRADQYVIGTDKFVAFKTQNLSDLLADNFEFQINESTGDFADGTLVSAGTDNDIDLTARNPGVLGNGITLTLTDVGNTFTGLPAVAVSGTAITVSINEGVTTAAEVIEALDESSPARLKVTAANATGDDGSGTVAAGTQALTGGGANLPSELTAASSGYISTTWAQLYSATGLVLRFKASSAGEYANDATLNFSKDSFGSSAIEYRESDVSEKAVELVIQPSGVDNSFIDFMPGFVNLGDFEEADYTLLSAAASLTLALGAVDSLDLDPDVRTTFTWNSYEFYESVPTAFSSGRSGIPDDYDELIGAVIGNPADETGVYSFANREQFNNSLLATPGFDQSAVIRETLALCENSANMFYLADTPGGVNLDLGLQVAEVVDWHNGNGFGNSSAFNSSYGATYHSWQKTTDIFNDGVDHWVPPSVLVMEQIAFSDRVGEVWFAPAGFRRGRLTKSAGVQAGGKNNQGDRDYMYSGGNAVNPIVNFPRDGVAIFGQRTLQRTPSALDRINVRRMLNFVKTESAAAVRIDLFEPLDTILFRQIRQKLTPIYQEVQNRRGINRFEVVLDTSSTTARNLENSEVVGFIVIEPTKAAEKIILNFVVTAQGAQFSEALAAVGVA